tara:strand:- start:20 stop:163 length:144 start_codon:yes stop_codon:yes gene_type:complete
MSNKALMTALGTAVAVAGGLYLYYNVIAKEEVVDPAVAFGGRSRRRK